MKCRVANGTQSNGLNRIFANKENSGKRFGTPLYYLNNSHFFNETDFEHYLYKMLESMILIYPLAHRWLGWLDS